MRQKLSKPFLYVCGIVVLLAALCIILYPVFSNILTERNKSMVITEYQKEVEQIDTSEQDKMIEDAMAYNKTLVPVISETGETLSKVKEDNYYDVLNLNVVGMMAYIEIPKTSTYLPIYHGTDALTLETGVGHLRGTSLPVGGPDTHCVISGHSGLSTSKMFSDIDKLEIGDVFYLHVLSRTLAYEVNNIQTVLPNDVDGIKIVRGQDLCTLITCVPFGVNTHRLLVTGSRIPYDEEAESSERTEEEQAEQSTSTWTEQYLRGVLTGIGALAIFTIGFYIGKTLIAKHKAKAKSCATDKEGGVPCDEEEKNR